MTDDFFQRVKLAERPVVVDLWAPWCPPCRTIAPHLERLAETFDGQVDLWKINTDEHGDVSRALGVRGIPTLIAFRDGEEIARRVGAIPPDQLHDLFEIARSGEPEAGGGESPTAAGRANGVGPSNLDRGLRLAAGLALLVFAWSRDQNWLLLLLAVIVLYSAVHDLVPSVLAATRRGDDAEEASSDESDAS